MEALIKILESKECLGPYRLYSFDTVARLHKPYRRHGQVYGTTVSDQLGVVSDQFGMLTKLGQNATSRNLKVEETGAESYAG